MQRDMTVVDRRILPDSIFLTQRLCSKSITSANTPELVSDMISNDAFCRRISSLSPSVYTLAHELLPGRFRPTPTHSFIRLLHDHKALHTCFTQNIDTLERRAGIPGDKIVEAHGSFANQHCIECGTEYDDEKMRHALKTGEIAKCPECEGLVKPDIVFFGESVRGFLHRMLPSLLSIYHQSFRKSFTSQSRTCETLISCS